MSFIFVFAHAVRLVGSQFPARATAVKVPSPNHWTAREFLKYVLFDTMS